MPARKQIAAILADHQDNSTCEELLRELVFAQMIDRGLADAETEWTMSHEEMAARISSLEQRERGMP